METAIGARACKPQSCVAWVLARPQHCIRSEMDGHQIDISTFAPGRDPLCDANHLLCEDGDYSSLLLGVDNTGVIDGIFKRDHLASQGGSLTNATPLGHNPAPSASYAREQPLSSSRNRVGSSPHRHDSFSSAETAQLRERTEPSLNPSFSSPTPQKFRKITCETPPSVLEMHFPSTPFSDCTSQAESQLESLFLSAPRIMPENWESSARQGTESTFYPRRAEMVPGPPKIPYTSSYGTPAGCCSEFSRDDCHARPNGFNVSRSAAQPYFEGGLSPMAGNYSGSPGPNYMPVVMDENRGVVPMPAKIGPITDQHGYHTESPSAEHMKSGNVAIKPVAVPTRPGPIPVRPGAIPFSTTSPMTMPKIRRYSTSTASKFCHICARSAKLVSLVTCRNVRFGLCRKTICYKCFTEQGWNWDMAVERPNDFWCSHCLSVCPRNAQCRTYERTNERRRQEGVKKRQLRKAQKGALCESRFEA